MKDSPSWVRSWLYSEPATTTSDYLRNHEPFRFVGRSVRNLFLPARGLAGDAGLAIGIEATSVCNARCVFCAYRLGFRPAHTLSKSDFRRRARGAVAFGFKHLELTPVTGEVFVHPEAVALIREGKDSGFESVRTYTNGILIHHHGAREILQSGLDALSISFPGFDKTVYREIYGVDKYDEFELSVRELLEMHSRIDSKVSVSFDPRTYLTEEQLSQSAFYTDVITPHLGERVKLNKPNRFFDDWCGSIGQRHMPMGISVSKVPIKSLAPLKRVHLCGHLFFIGILANGDVRLCNCRYDRAIQTPEDSLLIGNLDSSGGDVAEFLSAKQGLISQVREDFQGGRLPAACRSCSFYAPVKITPGDALF